MIPDGEIVNFLQTIFEAQDLGGMGQFAVGYETLVAGLERAREIAESGPPWAPELVSRWGIALDRYCELFGVKLE